MSGSEFERENIVMDALSAAPASKPDQPLGEEGLREHNWRPPAEGLYDPSLEKDSCGVGFIAVAPVTPRGPERFFRSVDPRLQLRR